MDVEGGPAGLEGDGVYAAVNAGLHQTVNLTKAYHATVTTM